MGKYVGPAVGQLVPNCNFALQRRLAAKSAEQWPGLLAQVATNGEQLNQRLHLNRDYKSAPADRPL
jgi:hypothetical protein